MWPWLPSNDSVASNSIGVSFIGENVAIDWQDAKSMIADETRSDWRARRSRNQTMFKRVILCSFACLSSLPIQALDLFDSTTQSLASASELPSWHELLKKVESETETINACLANRDICKGRLRSVHVLIDKGSTLSRKRQVSLVNRFVNRFTRYRSDKRKTTSVAGQDIAVRQQWSTLTEFLRLGGDCEDYATAKYQLLRLFNVPAEDLRIVVVYDRHEREHHAVLAVANVDGYSLLLDTDNRTYKRRPSRYQFVFAVNEHHVWDFGTENSHHSRRVRRALDG